MSSKHSPQVILVHLRRPQNGQDLRNDPFWEFGSFGITECHKSNLMNPNKCEELVGARLAFAQSGNIGTRLVFLSPPILRVVRYKDTDTVEALWEPKEMPFRYDSAPILVDNKGDTNFPKLKGTLAGTNRSTWVAKLASRFRSRRRALDEHLASELIQTYEASRAYADPSVIAENYVDALPVRRPPVSAADRERQYHKYQETQESEDGVLRSARGRLQKKQKRSSFCGFVRRCAE